VKNATAPMTVKRWTEESLDLRETSVGTPVETKSAVDPKKSDAAAKELKDLVNKKDKKVSIAEIQAILNKYKQ
jgi:hypothetical protein